jgi:phospholipase/lecithinase/hemolysin
MMSQHITGALALPYNRLMNFCRTLALCAAVLALALPARAVPFSHLAVYGDSLSDSGNFYAAIGMPGPPYYAGRASDGPVAVEYLAAALGTPLLNFAWFGATTGIGNQLDGGTATSVGPASLPGMRTAYEGSAGAIAPLAPSALFLVWGGPDDFFAPSPLDANLFATADRAAANLVSIVNQLEGLGAQHVLVLGMPDLGLAPRFRAMGPADAAGASLLTNYFNDRLAVALPANVMYFDTAGLLRQIVADPARYGLANVTDACLNAAASAVCGTPGQYLFWDDVHPTTRGHAILAGQLAAAIPEPAPSVLALSTCALLLLRRRLRG